MALVATLYLILTRIFVGLYLKSPESFGRFRRKKIVFQFLHNTTPESGQVHQ